MTIPVLIAAIAAASLGWSAAFTAAAARARRGRLLLALLAVIVPTAVLAWPAILAARLTFPPRLPNPLVFPVAVSLVAAALVGGVWIVRAGLRASPGLAPPALDWPAGPLAGASALAALVAWGAFSIEDRSVAAVGDRWADEAAKIVASNLPPATRGATSAAALHRHAASLLAADRALEGPDSPLANPDAAGPAAGDLLARHADTLDLVRRAAELDSCRFDRDWSRVTFSTLLPEVQSLRDEGRLLALAARRAAAEGRGRDALADTIRLHRLAAHAAEPCLVTHLVAMNLRRMACDTLGEVLPLLGPDDLPLLDDPALADMAAPPPGLLVPLLGEEAMYLTFAADVARSRLDVAEQLRELGPNEPLEAGWNRVPSAAYRVFFLQADVATIRRQMRRFEDLAVSRVTPDQRAGVAWWKAAEEAEADLRSSGPVVTMLTPGFAAIENGQRRSEALAGAVRVALAATRMRLATGALPDSCAALVPRFLGAVPADPYAADGVLSLAPVDGGIVIFSVGPDGEDNGGPAERGEVDIEPGRDDVGLWLAPAPRAASDAAGITPAAPTAPD